MDVINGSTKSCFKFFLEFFVRGRINCVFAIDTFLILLGCRSRQIEYEWCKKTYFRNN